MRKLTVGMYIFWLVFAVVFASQVKAGEIYLYAGLAEYPSSDAGAPLDVASSSNPRRYINFTTAGGKAMIKMPMPKDMPNTEAFSEVDIAYSTPAVGAVGNCGIKICIQATQDEEGPALTYPANSRIISTAVLPMAAQYVRQVVPIAFGIQPTDAAGADCDTATNTCKGLFASLLIERDETVVSNSTDDCSIIFIRFGY